MTARSCPRSFEVEALRDGRLAGAEREAFERHLTVCSSCAHESEALQALATALRAGSANADDLHVRRERTRLLAAFDRSLIEPERRDLRPFVGLLAAALLVAVVLVSWRARSTEMPVSRASNAVVEAKGTAVWSKRTDKNRETVVLERGALRIQVTHASGEGPILVLLPDGELEDTGTTFTVSAEDGHTTHVAVEEGSVVLRLRGHPPMTIVAGDSWRANANPSVVASASPAPSAVPVPPTSATNVRRPEPTSRSAVPNAPPTAPPATATVVADSAADFRAAMALLDAADNERAAAAFANFGASHPHDARAEDASYLRVIALQRAGSIAMKAAAEDYLRRYPTGFRRAEIEPLTR
jgi:anti-sigma factor RsiW